MPAQKEVRHTDAETGRIVMFPARHSLARSKAKQTEVSGGRDEEFHVADLRQFEQSAEPDDYGRRMVINVAAFAVIVLLTLAGIWLVEQFALIHKQQDCSLMGRKGCADHNTHIRSE